VQTPGKAPRVKGCRPTCSSWPYSPINGVFGPRKLIAFPWDTVIAIVVTLAFHCWAVFSAFRTKAIDQMLGKA